MAGVCDGVILAEYLLAEGQRPFDWRFHNCGHFVGGWVATWRNIDRYEIDARAERDGRLRLCSELPFHMIVDRAMTFLELSRRSGPMGLGDVAFMTKNAGAPWKALGIVLPPFVALLADHGILYTRAEPLAVWALR